MSKYISNLGSMNLVRLLNVGGAVWELTLFVKLFDNPASEWFHYCHCISQHSSTLDPVQSLACKYLFIMDLSLCLNSSKGHLRNANVSGFSRGRQQGCWDVRIRLHTSQWSINVWRMSCRTFGTGLGMKFATDSNFRSGIMSTDRNTTAVAVPIGVLEEGQIHIRTEQFTDDSYGSEQEIKSKQTLTPPWWASSSSDVLR